MITKEHFEHLKLIDETKVLELIKSKERQIEYLRETYKDDALTINSIDDSKSKLEKTYKLVSVVKCFDTYEEFKYIYE